ncbi:MAG: peptidylprolyl isomerase, partial [Thermoanaerobaculia bacterium]
MNGRRLLPLTLALLLPPGLRAETPAPNTPPTMAEILTASKPSDWRPLDPENTLVVELPAGRAVIELAPAFAPEHVENVKKLVRAKYFDGLAFLRSQDNYVVQWGDPNADDRAAGGPGAKARPIAPAREKLPAEFTRPLSGLPFTRLPDVDGYSPEAGFSGGFPAARDPKSGRAWLAHCYGMVGVGRGDALDSGNGSEIYVVIGNAPRHLDKNVALIGRVLQGMELLSTLPRGSAAMGFYEKGEERSPIRSIRVAADLPGPARPNLEVFRTDTSAFSALVESRRNRRESWFASPAGYVELCNVPI